VPFAGLEIQHRLRDFWLSSLDQTTEFRNICEQTVKFRRFLKFVFICGKESMKKRERIKERRIERLELALECIY
jgi:hypothetical protein